MVAQQRSRTVPGWVAQQYYRIGLLAASRPRPVLLVAVLTVIYACWPLLSVPIYIGRPSTFVESPNANLTRPVWLELGQPVAYVQQIIVKSMVQPYKKDELIKTDAFRGPLASAFKLHLEDIALFRSNEADMDHVCLRTDGIAEKYRHWAITTNILPDYGCLILSPANLWSRDPRSFQFDANVINTVFNFQRNQREGHSSLADLMFGLRQRDTGITKYPVRNRQRVISYAVTIAFSKYNSDYVSALKRHLMKQYPLIDEFKNLVNLTEDKVHVFFAADQRTSTDEWVPIFITILMVFFYVYFSIKRVEFIRSKLGIALTAIATVICATCMSLGASGISLNVNSKISLVPYLVAFISLENILVITQSVISTQAHLDVKIRIAQGISREGWNITKNLCAEITILSFIFLLGTIEASMQEFTHLALMGLLSDFFLQIFFFVPILSIDMNQQELSDSIKKPRKSKMFQKPVSGPGRIRKTSTAETSVMAPNTDEFPEVLPKRVRLINFFAKKRIIQRMFLISMVGWISIFIYNSGLLDTLIRNHQLELFLPSAVNVSKAEKNSDGPFMTALSDLKNLSDSSSDEKKSSSCLKKLLPLETWPKLPITHWPMLFSLYNLSLQGRYVTFLPPIHLSIVIGSERAKALRHPKEAAEAKNTENTEKSEEVELDKEDEEYFKQGPELSPFVPTSPSELFLAFALCFPSLLFILYLIMVLYRCICSRNYAEWRSSWNNPEIKAMDSYTQIVRESVPIELDGHKHEVECLGNDGNIVISLCLGGALNVWDSYTGEQISEASRTSTDETSLPAKTSSEEFAWTINTNFAEISKEDQVLKNGEYDFQRFYKAKNGLKMDEANAEAVWAMDCEDGLTVLGCAKGRIEIWDTISCQFKCMYDDGKQNGITHLKLCSGHKLVVARLTGHLEFFEIKVASLSSKCYHRTNSTPPPNIGPTRRHHVRTGSGVSFDGLETHYRSDEDLQIEWLYSARAHPQPLTCLDCQGGRILTGSHDHTLRVFRVDDHLAIYTLHGHFGPITASFIDKEEPSCAFSGSQDGLMCTWDLLSGACVYSIQAHDGSLLNLAYSSNYIISMGSDERLCVWERLQGHLINSICLNGGPYCPDLVMLTHNLLVTGRQNNLVLWDVRLPDPVKIVKIGHPDCSQNIKMLSHLEDDAIVCSYGNKLRLVRFPSFSAKSE